MRGRALNVGEVAAALAFVALGLFMVWEASGYPYGSLRRMGPGFFPLWIGVVLAAFGLALLPEVRRLATAPRPILPRPLAFIPLGLLAFALLLERAGLVPATATLLLLSGLGHHPLRLRALLLSTLALSLAAYVVLILAIGVPLNAFWR